MQKLKFLKEFVVLEIFLISLTLFGSNIVKADKVVNLTGKLTVLNEYKLNQDDVSKDDLDWIKGLPATNSNWTVKTSQSQILADEELSSSGAEIQSNIDKTVLKDNLFTLKVDSNNPVIVVKSKLGDPIQSFNVTKQQLKNGVVNLIIKNDLNKKLSEMNKNLNDSGNDNLSSLLPFVNFSYYKGQNNGHKYKAGVHVQCNDFNGPANISHYYWSRRSGKIAAAKALKNFVGSDCDHHQTMYGCEMSGNTKCRGLSKHPTNCSSFTSYIPHVNWPVTLHWRS